MFSPIRQSCNMGNERCTIDIRWKYKKKIRIKTYCKLRTSVLVRTKRPRLKSGRTTYLITFYKNLVSKKEMNVKGRTYATVDTNPLVTHYNTKHPWFIRCPMEKHRGVDANHGVRMEEEWDEELRMCSRERADKYGNDRGRGASALWLMFGVEQLLSMWSTNIDIHAVPQ